MKKCNFILFILSVLIFISCNNETGFTIKGRITGIPDSTQVMLKNISTNEFLDSSLVINNEFVFNGKLSDEPEELRIISGLKELQSGLLFYTDLLMSNENVKVRGDISDLPYNVTTTGSSIQDKAENYRKQLYVWDAKLDSLKNHLQSIVDTTNTIERKEAKKRIKAMKDSIEIWEVALLKDNFNSYIGLLKYNYRRDFNNDTLKKLFNSVSEELKQSKYGKAIAIQINYPAPRKGGKYYDFEAQNKEGNSFRLSEIGNRYILLQFAGTGCYGSNLAIKKIKKIHKKFKDSVSFISFFVDPQNEVWQNYTTDNNISWISLWDNGGKYGDIYNKYGITGTPTFFLISPEKKVVSTWFGYEDGIIESKIRKAIEQTGE